MDWLLGGFGFFVWVRRRSCSLIGGGGLVGDGGNGELLTLVFILLSAYYRIPPIGFWREEEEEIVRVYEHRGK